MKIRKLIAAALLGGTAIAGFGGTAAAFDAGPDTAIFEEVKVTYDTATFEEVKVTYDTGGQSRGGGPYYTVVLEDLQMTGL